jgi:hypothetical protein
MDTDNRRMFADTATPRFTKNYSIKEKRQVIL